MLAQSRIKAARKRFALLWIVHSTLRASFGSIAASGLLSSAKLIA